VKQTVAAEGPRGLYKGMGAPLATVAAFNAVLFSVRGQMEALLRSEPGVPLTVKQQVVAGAGAGIAVSFLACPTELIKCRSVESGQFFIITFSLEPWMLT
jgi:solute carrier family 25 carnitine/acylcarnitine transporter 20/29